MSQRLIFCQDHTMKRVLSKTGVLGFMAMAIAAFGSGLTACSAQTQTNSQLQTSSPTVAPAGNPSMDHGTMSGMNHNMDMDLGPADAEFDLRFIDAMTPHHQGAVEMAKAAQQKSKRPEIQKLAASIIQSQDKEINQMKQWRQAWYPKVSKEAIAWHSQMGHSMPMSQDQKTSMMMTMDLGAADANFDLRFLNAMTPHHQGAVTMAQDALNKSKRPEIQKLANDIIVSQKAEISQMEKWRKAWYSK
ncbi:DUF305 domain-containing protein [Leptolyngbyaceae cyanobacterium UHCC 1019]